MLWDATRCPSVLSGFHRARVGRRPMSTSQNLIQGIHWWFRTPGDSLSSCRCLKGGRSWSPEANREPALRCCWNRSCCAIKLPCWSAAELVARASVVGIVCLWILLSRSWPQWRESLMIVQPETVLRWRRIGWSAIWGYRSRGSWLGERPRVCSEVRHLINRTDGP